MPDPSVRWPRAATDFPNLAVAATLVVLDHYGAPRDGCLGIRTAAMSQVQPLHWGTADFGTAREHLDAVAARIAELERRPPCEDPGIRRYPVVVDFARETAAVPPADVVLDGDESGLVVRRSEAAVAAGAAGRLPGHLEVVMRALLARADRPVATISPLTEAERHAILVRRNDTGAPYRRDRTIPQLVDEWACSTPEAVAVRCAGAGITYRELVARANRLARAIRAARPEPDAPVAVCVPRGIDMVVAKLAVLKTGAPYLPIDPGDPGTRVATVLRIASAELAVVSEQTAARMRSACPIVDLSDLARYDDGPIEIPSAPTDPAAVLFTSGSTGEPKAVPLTHRAITRIADRPTWLPLCDSTVLAQSSHAAFDWCAYQIWGALINGARLVVVPDAVLLSPRALAAAIEAEGIDTLCVTTALFHDLIGRDPAVFTGVARLLVAGERLRSDALRKALRHSLPRHVYNLYGPTENGVYTTYHECSAADSPTVPIGRPVPNTTVYLLDRRRAPVADGVVGDLYAGGDGLSPGYPGRPGLTAERFVPNPFGPGVLFDTGDRARHRHDGVLEFHGRRDFQCKIRGFRIEPEEVETQLIRCPDVRLAAVAPSADTGTDRHLVAFVVPSGGATADLEEIRRRLGAALPAAAVPGRFVIMEELPLNTHGKIDRGRLAELAAEPDPTPSDDVEIAVAALWRDVLRVDRVAPDDDFFAIGGDSRLVTQLVHRVNTLFGADIEPVELFEEPTVAGFARVIRARRGHAAPTAEPTAPASAAPLTWPQESLWDTCVLATGGPLYNESFTVTIRGDLEPDALAAALDDLLARHVALRTGFAETDDGVVQRAADVRTLPLTRSDLSGLPSEDRAGQAESLSTAQARMPFGLDRPPLARAQLIRFGPDHHELHVVAHHLVADGISFSRALAPDLYALYRSRTGHPGDAPPPVPIEWLDHARTQRAEVTATSCAPRLHRVAERLRGARPTELPLPQPRPPISSFRGARRTHRLPDGAGAWVTTMSRTHGVTPTSVLLSLFQIALYRITGATDLLTGLVQDSRPSPEWDRVCGHFVEPGALRCDLSGDPAYPEILARTHAAHIACQGMRTLPLALVEQQVASPLFRIAFSTQPRTEEVGPGWSVRFNTLDNGTARLDLTLFARIESDSVELVFEYATDVVPVAVVDRLADALCDTMTTVAARPDTRLSDLAAPAADEVAAATRRTVTEAWAAQLGVPPRSRHSDFFDAGGTSVRASRLIATARRRFDLDIAHTSVLTRAFLRDSTVDGLAGALTAALARHDAPHRPPPSAHIDFEAEATLPDDLEFPGRPTVSRDRPESVLLTGATGFLGSHLLAELLGATDATIHCLVRAGTRERAEERIRAGLRTYGVSDEIDPERVIATPGDLTEPRFGLSDTDFRRLAEEVDVVFHNAAWVNFIYPYETLRPANVGATIEILRLAATGKTKRLHYISSQGVFASQGLAGVARVDENTVPTDPHHLLMGYVETKWVSEILLRRARERGLDVSVHRPHDIGGDSRSGRWKSDGFVPALIAGCAEIGCVPDYPLPLDLTPVDIVARAIVDLALHREPVAPSWNLNNPRYARVGDLAPVLADAGHPVDVLPAAEWLERLRRHTDRRPDSVLAPFTHLFTERWTDRDLSVVELYLEGRMPVIDCSATWGSVGAPGTACPPARQLLPRYVRYLSEAGFLRTAGR
ncbi:amino acid adenylation domain-containing protein [Nocardia sp. NPDC004068]|uniref:amino acid adenylation domain-containing protein n=1 Tax=Nocardia sp. NPDC004068 TaxID=3364303 RepID=UPI00367F46EA